MQSDRFGKGWGFRCFSQRKPGGFFSGSLQLEMLQVRGVTGARGKSTVGISGAG